jgi:hypothetical protein
MSRQRPIRRSNGGLEAEEGRGGRVEGPEAGLPHDRRAAGRGFDREAALIVGDGEAAVDAVAVGAGRGGVVKDRLVFGYGRRQRCTPGSCPPVRPW